MNKKKIFISLGIGVICTGLLFGYSNIALSDPKVKVLEKELTVQKSVINTFDLNTVEYKPLLTSDIYESEGSTVSSEIRVKIAGAISVLQHDKELKEGDFKPMIFLKGKNTVLIGITHPDETITLTEFDISKKTPEKITKQIKEIKK